MKYTKWKLLALFVLFTTTLTSCGITNNSGSSEELPSSDVNSSPADTYYRTLFLNYDGSFLYLSRTKHGESAVYNGETPTRDATEYMTYSFTGWDKSLHNIKKDTEFFATYNEQAINFYDVYFVNYDGDPLYHTVVREGGNAVYEGPYPTRPNMHNYIFTFAGWNRSLTNIQSTTFIVALYEASEKPLEVEFVNYDGSLLDKIFVVPGDHAIYGGQTPVRESTPSTTYTFRGWDKPLTYIYNNETFIAQYDEFINTRTVTFLNYDGSFLFEEDVIYGHNANYVGKNPERETAGRYQYTFIGWDKDISSVTSNIVVKAVFRESIRDNSTGLQYSFNEQGSYYYVTGYNGDSSDVYVGRSYSTSYYGEHPIRGIGSAAFRNNSIIKNIYLENTIFYIENDAFYDAYNLENITISQNLQRIGDNAFRYTKIMNFEIPAFVTHIGARAFNSLPEQAKITINPSNINYKIIDNFLTDGVGKTLYGMISDQKDEHIVFPEGIEIFESYSFSNNTMSKSYVFPASTKLIKERAFSYNSNVKSISFNNAEAIIQSYAFYSTNNLEMLDLGTKVKEIFNDNFSSSKLRTITLPASLTRLDERAFDQSFLIEEYIVDVQNMAFKSMYKGLFSKDLETLFRIPVNLRGSFTIPSETKYINKAFNTENELSVFLVEPGNNEFRAIDGIIHSRDGKTLIKAPGLIKIAELRPDVETIAEKAFYNTRHLTSITFNHNLKTIDQYAFTYNEGLTSLVFPDSLTTIAPYAFSQLASLETVKFGKGMTEVSYCAFEYSRKLEEVIFNDEMTTIGNHAFASTNIKKLVLGKNIETIGDYAFERITNLQEITFNTELKEIGYSAFYNSVSLEKLQFNNGLEKIMARAFAYSYEIALIEFGENLKYIGEHAFEHVYALEELTFNANLEHLGRNAFAYNYGLKTLTINNKLEEIPFNAFYSNYSLERLELGANVKYIGESAFYNANSLETIIANNELIEIGSYAFYETYNLKTIIGLPAQVNINLNSFSGSNHNIEIYATGSPVNNTFYLYFDDAIVFFYSEAPIYDGYHWRYVDNVPVIWVENE